MVSSEPGPTLLRSYSVYIIFLACNGVTECFMFAAMSAKQVADYNWRLMAFSVREITKNRSLPLPTLFV